MVSYGRGPEWDAVLNTHARLLRVTDPRLPEFDALSASLIRAVEAVEAKIRSQPPSPVS